ncbi:uncharacterized protein LOC115237871 isoform X2 [Formica exsecta]|uniref:uncharacterized protein LOC115237871 isoform X2 n=1 Tax=Formica exsecta TaxID=72781 RepID=UPI001141F39F|nr:uncharacterized protein LOC115237871 isoform X2 [Formica exsecta]
METRKDHRSTIKIFDKSEPRSDELPIALIHRAGISDLLARQTMAWCRHWLQTFPIRMTLNNVGLLTVFLAIMSPRSLIYTLVYPIFRLVFGTLYPAYASYKAVRTKNVKEYVKWMMYWIVFALFTCAETFTDVFFSFWFPFYYEIKIILVLWLLSPATKGSSILYRRFVHPALIRREAEIDEAIARATEQGYTAVLHLGTKGVNYATTVLMQTAIKGGGGLVQQLRKSYSLSDLTGEKEDENRNTPDARDETDMEEPRRREHTGRRGYSPRRTQSSSNASRVDMYFSEVDVDVRQPRPREPIASLTNIRSSEDISSGYSSGEALQSQRITSQVDSLVRTSSVGARTRVKPRSTTKKTPEDKSEDFNHIDLPSPENISLPSSLNVLTPEQAIELLLLFSQNNKSKDCPILESIATCIDESVNENQSAIKIEDNESSSTESSGEFVDTDSAQVDLQTVQTIEIENISMEKLSIPAIAESADKINVDNSIKELNFQQDESQMQIEYDDKDSRAGQVDSSQNPDIDADIEQTTSEICQQKFNELKELLNDAHKIATSIVSSQEKLNTIDKGKEYDVNVSGMKVDDSPTREYDTTIQRSVTPISSSCNLDSDNRAGKYHKKPAPKAPLDTEAITNNEDTNENESQNALKATLIIKTGTLRTVSNADATKDIFLAHTTDLKKRKKKSNRLRAKESFSKLLTIPKNIFHNAFHKEQSETSSKEDDSSSTFSETSESVSRSGSIGSQMCVDASAKLSTSRQEIDVEEISLRAECDNTKSFYKDANSAEKSDTLIVPLNEKDLNKIKNNKTRNDARNIEDFENYEKNLESKSNLEICEMSQSLPHSSKTEIITDII